MVARKPLPVRRPAANIRRFNPASAGELESRPVFEGLTADLFGKDTQAARRVFRYLLVSPIVVTPQPRDDGPVRFTFACEASFAGLPADHRQRWDVPAGKASTTSKTAKGPKPGGLYAPESDDAVDHPEDGPEIADGRQQNHLLTGALTRRPAVPRVSTLREAR